MQAPGEHAADFRGQKFVRNQSACHALAALLARVQPWTRNDKKGKKLFDWELISEKNRAV